MVAGDEWDLEMVGGGNDAIGHIRDNIAGDLAQTLGQISWRRSRRSCSSRSML
jgi:hypothetical protein